MNTENTQDSKADALEALAAQAGGGQTDSPDPQIGESDADCGQEPTVSAPPETATGEQDPFGRLAAAADAASESATQEPPENPDAQGFLQQMAQESGVASPELSKLRALTGGYAEVVEVDGSGGFVATGTPTIRTPQRAARLQANTRLMHSQAFKQTMIPLLLVVGGLLIFFCVVTGAMLISEGFDSNPAAPGGLQTYGKYFIVAALPIGAILIMGAWLFYLDTRKSAAGQRDRT